MPPLQLRVQLVNGNTHRIPLAIEDPAQVLEQLRAGGTPFSAEWLEDADGEMIRVSAIASAYVEPAGGPDPIFMHG